MNLKVALPPVLVAVLGLGALAGVQATGFREQVEAKLTGSAQEALDAAGLDEVDVELRGRDAAVTAPIDADALVAAGLVGDLDGIRVAAAYGPGGPVPAGTTLVEAEAAVEAPAKESGTPEAAHTEPAHTELTHTELTQDERKAAQNDLAAIPDITFVTDSATLAEDGRDVVRRAADVLGKHPEVVVGVEGHTDSVGSESHNQKLSELRAEQVLAGLVALGVDRERLTSTGFGESDPLVVPLTFADLEKNRRVELTVQG